MSQGSRLPQSEFNQSLPLSPNQRRVLERKAEDKNDEQSLKAALKNHKISFDFENTPFLDAIQFLRENTEFNYVVQSGALDLIRSEKLTVSLKIKGISLKNALQLIRSAHYALDCRIERGLIVFALRSHPVTPRETHFFKVSDILEPRCGARLGPKKLLELLQFMLGDSEVEDGSLALSGHILSGRLSKRGQKRIESFLKLLRAHHKRLAQENKNSTHPWWTIYNPKQLEEPNWIRRINFCLRSTRVTVQFQQRPLRDVIQKLDSLTPINFSISPRIQAADLLIDLHLKGARLQDALELTLEQAKLSYRLENETIKVVPIADLNERRHFDIIGIQDLISDQTQDSSKTSKQESMTSEQILKVCLRELDKDSWQSADFLEVHRGQILIFQTEARIHKLREILVRLREAQQRKP